MTREEAIRILDGLKPNTAIAQGNETAYDIGQALSMAINALTALEKIRDEIDDLQNTYIADGDYNEGIRFGAMQAYLIIDKYTKGDADA